MPNPRLKISKSELSQNIENHHAQYYPLGLDECIIAIFNNALAVNEDIELSGAADTEFQEDAGRLLQDSEYQVMLVHYLQSQDNIASAGHQTHVCDYHGTVGRHAEGDRVYTSGYREKKRITLAH